MTLLIQTLLNQKNIKRATGTWQAWTSGNPFHPTLANVLISAKMRSFPVKFCSRPSLIVLFLMGKGGGGMTMRVGGGGGLVQEFFSMKSFSRASRIVLLLMGKGEGRRENVCWGSVVRHTHTRAVKQSRSKKIWRSSPTPGKCDQSPRK